MKWPIVPLEKLAANEPASIKIGPFGSQLKRSELVTEGIHVIGIENILSNTFDGLGDRYITGEKFATLRSVEVKPGDVLITMMGTIGEVSVVPPGTSRSIMDSHLLRFRPNSRLCFSEYVVWLLKGSASTRLQLQGRAHGAIMKGLNSSIIRSLPAPLPAPSEQRRIIEILDEADALRKLRIEADAKAERILPALFYKMFGEPVTNPMGWGITTLYDKGALVRYGMGQPPKLSPNGVPLIRATNIKRGTITENDMMLVDATDVPESRNAFLSADEVIVVRSGAYTGDVAQVTEQWKGAVAGYDLVVTPGGSFCGEYIEAYLLTAHIQKNYFGNLKARAGQPHLNAAQLLATPILCPPKALQLCFADSVRKIRHILKWHAELAMKLNDLFAVLLHRAFIGELTAKWRNAHMKEVLAEMEEQANVLQISPVNIINSEIRVTF